MGFSMGTGNIGCVLTKNDVTLGSGGVGRATGYQNIHKNDVGDTGSTQSDVWGTLEAFPRLSSVFFCKFYRFGAV